MNGRNGIVMLAIVISTPLLFAACPKNAPPSKPRATISTTTRPNTTAAHVVAAFDGERAMGHVRKQIDFGPRPPDSPPAIKTRAYIAIELKNSGWKVSLDEFTAATPEGEKKMANIVAELAGETQKML